MRGEIISLETAKKLQDYEDRINKAIKRLEKGIFIIPKDTNEVINILKGDSNDRKEEGNN